MPDRHDPPPTAEGWYAVHDFRRIDWDAWRDAPERTREHALSAGVEHLESRLAVDDADEGASALYSVLGHEADLLVLHLRPTTAHVDALQRQFERTALAEFTERASSFVSVTEASGYSERAREYIEGEADDDPGLANHIHTRLEPAVPDATHVCFYPMDRRRDPEQNWYDLPFEQRADHMDAHGDIGRDYRGRVVQMITTAVAIDDWERGVTLWSDDLTEIKDLLYEMRFDPSTSNYVDFGFFRVGRRFPPADLPALFAGDPVPADGETPAETAADDTDSATGRPGLAGAAIADDPTDSTAGDGGDDGGATALPDTEVSGDVETVEDDEMVGRLATLGCQAGEDYPTGSYGLAVYSTADAQQLAEEVDSLRGDFEHYDSHVLTSVRATQGRSVVVSIWETERAAGIAEGLLTDLSAVSRSVSGPLGEATDSQDEGHVAGTSRRTREELADMDIYAGQPHGEDVHALVLYSSADIDRLRREVSELADGFDRYDTHEGSAVYEDSTSDRTAVVSLWATEDAARTASDHLTNLPGIVGWADDTEGFSTMGMFYTVKPEYREEFVDTFADVGEMLEGIDGHRQTTLLANVNNKNDMFISSHWDRKEDAMAFFGSDTFTDAVNLGREMLNDRPRHVFLA